ncbi:MAG: NAD-dependent epimerase/dehydratase family protein [bacterium]|nr:NAD-dependent epimerase/dehydratase family protein [bacterium]
MVTGGTGIVGSYVVRELVRCGHRPVVVDLAPPAGSHDQLAGTADYYAADIRELSVMLELCQTHGVSTIFHLAALTGRASYHQPMVPFRVNLEGTMNVFEAARLTGVRRLVMASSRNVYRSFEGTPHGPPSYLPVPEEYPPDPQAPYEVMKFTAERMGMFYRSRFGLEFAAFRFATYYAAERIVAANDRSGALIEKMHTLMLNSLRGRPTTYAAGSERKVDCVYVGDLARAFVLAGEAPSLPSAVYNVGSGQAKTIADLVHVLRLAVPGTRIDIGAGHDFGEGASPGRTGVLDIRRACRDLGYRPHWTFQDGVLECLERARGLMV